MHASKPIKILHVVGGMNRGGVETWLMHVLRHIDRELFQMDFLTHTTAPCAYDDEIRALGSRLLPCLHPSRPWQYARNFKRILRENGSYDVIHSHVHHYSGYVLWLAAQAGIKTRIAHSHSDTAALQARAGFLRRGYLQSMEWLLRRYATCGLSASRKAAAALFGAKWESEPRWRLLYYGIDFSPFYQHISPNTVRSELQIPSDAFVIGHVGSFSPVKNHAFLAEIAAEVVKREPNTYMLLVGDGPLRPTIEQQAQELGIGKQVIFAGVRADVHRMMRAMDVFVMPSFYEGLSIACLEAQGSGLPVILADVIPEEVDQINPLIHRLSLRQTAFVWAENILTRKSRAKITRHEAISMLEKSVFNITYSVRHLQQVYTEHSNL